MYGFRYESCTGPVSYTHLADSPEMIAYAKEQGAKGITISGVCCTSNEVAMRRGIPMAGNFLQQENVVLTGACEAIVVDCLLYTSI